jgi:Domain of unknown function (DUF4328)
MSQGMLSADGQFYWDGTEWRSTLSTDGRWQWTGTEWRAVIRPRYRSPRSLGRWVIVLLCLILAETWISFIWMFYFDFTFTYEGHDLVYTIDLGGLAIFALTASIFLVWFHRSYANLDALGADGLQLGPDWAVGWWFVPVACCWKPYQAALEIWHASDPDAPARTSLESRRIRGHAALLAFWWATWLMSLVLLNIASLRILEPAVQGLLFIFSAAATTGAAALAIAVVRAIGLRQDARWSGLASQESQFLQQSIRN